MTDASAVGAVSGPGPAIAAVGLATDANKPH
jgi:hypothetical protein